MTMPAGIERIDTDFFGRTNSLYLLRGEKAVALVDTGIASTPADYLAPYLRESAPGCTIDFVVNTHADLDHVGGNRAVAEMFPASKQICHELDREWIDDFDRLIEERYDEYAALGMPESPETKDFLRTITGSKPTDMAIRGGEALDLSDGWAVEILHTPGHSHGHVALWDGRSRSLVIGDAVLSDGLYMTDGSPAFPPTYRYVKDYIATINRFIALAPETLFTSHYPTMTGDAAMSFLTGSLDFTARAAAAVEQALASASGPLTLQEVIVATSPALGPWGPDAALSLKFPLLGHLEDLEAEGRVTRVPISETVGFIETSRG
jgi:glyoxylase-like metal-dependent hydrolase (beta-lactamase superfamily II)